MLLDEPSNHLDLESLIWLEDFLKTYDGMLLMTSHDREFMNRIVTKIVEIDGGELNSYSGNYEFYESQRALLEKQQQAQFERQQAMLAKELKFIERFKARASHAAQVQSRVKKLDKIERVEMPKRRESVQFDFPAAPRSGEDVVALSAVHKAYGSRVIYDGFDFTIRRRERWCLMGVNGAGKSTLLKLVAGATEPDAGKVTLGASVKMGYFAQHAMELLDGEDTVFRSLERAFPQASQGSLRTLAGCFGFSGDDIAKPCRVLSGGEKARLVLAMLVWQRPNLLLLDEPTNHLDLQTREALSMALNEYEGTVMLVSHDRALLREVCDEFWLVAGGGVKPFDGDLDDYQQWLLEQSREAGPQETAKASAPKRAGDRNLPREIEQLDRRMAQLTEEKQRIDARLADPASYQSADRAALQKSTARQADLVRLLGEAEEKWLVLHEELEKQ